MLIKVFARSRVPNRLISETTDFTWRPLGDSSSNTGAARGSTEPVCNQFGNTPFLRCGRPLTRCDRSVTFMPAFTVVAFTAWHDHHSAAQRLSILAAQISVSPVACQTLSK